MNRQTGFTLLELVITMLLISILAVTVLPKFFGKSEFSPYAIRDQLRATKLANALINEIQG